MMKVVITFREVLEINNILSEKGINGKVHIHDGCGGQNFTFEILEKEHDDGYNDSVKDIITEYFKKKRIEVKFIGNELDFLLQKM